MESLTHTPLRRRAHAIRDGCSILSAPQTLYSDGTEDLLYDIVSSARDCSALSDELQTGASEYAIRYHLGRSRPNALRWLDLSPSVRVLEVGAGCGALSRWLGEHVAVVDALEPMLARARVARRRTADLDNVEVFVGSVGDVPPEPAYDIVLVVGVLEYVGQGSADPAIYADFLRACRRLLLPGGRLVCAIENRLGVKYLAGAGEDHTNRVFDGLEDYRVGASARTFTRRDLDGMFRVAGFVPRFFSCFPDYKETRVVLSDTLLDGANPLAWRLPDFPSPDWVLPRPHLVDEYSLWRSLVEEGAARHFANSYVVVGETVSAEPRSDWLATYFNTNRRAMFSTRSDVQVRNGSVTVERQLLLGSTSTAELAGARLTVGEEDLIYGDDLLFRLSRHPLNRAGPLLRSWVAVVRDSITSCYAGIDLVPHNMVVVDGDRLVAIDQEWQHSGYSGSDVIARGLLLTAFRLRHLVPHESVPGQKVVDLITSLTAATGFEPPAGWLAKAVGRESAFQAVVHGEPVEDCRKRLQAVLATPISDCSLGLREHERLTLASTRVAQLESELERYLHIRERLAPRGSLRGRLAASVLGQR